MSSSSVKIRGINVNSPGGFIVQQSYGLGVEAVKEPFDPRLGDPVPFAVR